MNPSAAPAAAETTFTRFLADLNHEYVQLHVAKEDAFWAAYMGLTGDPVAARNDLAAREIALQRFLQSPEKLKAVREQLARGEACLQAAVTAECPTQEEVTALKGWLLTFESNVIDSPSARALTEEIIADEGELANARGSMRLGYQVPDDEFVEASSVKLAQMIRTDPDPALRKAAWEGMRSIEDHVLAHGFIDIIKKRNALGRMLGGEDYYDWKVKRVEGMSKREIFDLLDDLEARTRDAAAQAIAALKAERGADQVTPWSIQYLTMGDVATAQDPYFPFARSLERWGRSFAALGIDYNGADLVLDLVDRKGKYENGFMHGPEPAWRDRGTYHRARIQFTA
ncbi:MAG TPA: peptidase M3, partial [bacterium]|nr:peptidase M3 [bacterium]